MENDTLASIVKKLQEIEHYLPENEDRTDEQAGIALIVREVINDLIVHYA